MTTSKSGPTESPITNPAGSEQPGCSPTPETFRLLPGMVAMGGRLSRYGAVVDRTLPVVDEVYELFMDLGADEHQIEFPIVYTNARAGTATVDISEPGTDLRPLLDLLVEHTPPPTYTPDHPLQLLVTNLAANDYVGRMAIGRVRNGYVRVMASPTPSKLAIDVLNCLRIVA